MIHDSCETRRSSPRAAAVRPVTIHPLTRRARRSAARRDLAPSGRTATRASPTAATRCASSNTSSPTRRPVRHARVDRRDPVEPHPPGHGRRPPSGLGCVTVQESWVDWPDMNYDKSATSSARSSVATIRIDPPGSTSSIRDSWKARSRRRGGGRQPYDPGRRPTIRWAGSDSPMASIAAQEAELERSRHVVVCTVTGRATPDVADSRTRIGTIGTHRDRRVGDARQTVDQVTRSPATPQPRSPSSEHANVITTRSRSSISRRYAIDRSRSGTLDHEEDRMQRTDVNVTTPEGDCPAILITPDGDGPSPRSSCSSMPAACGRRWSDGRTARRDGLRRLPPRDVLPQRSVRAVRHGDRVQRSRRARAAVRDDGQAHDRGGAQRHRGVPRLPVDACRRSTPAEKSARPATAWAAGCRSPRRPTTPIASSPPRPSTVATS